MRNTSANGLNFLNLSVLSTGGPLNEEDVEKIKNESPPPDTLFFVHLLFFLLGLMTVMPTTFFVTANDYWMYKFRDPSSNSTDANDRTVLQKNFVAVQTVANAISAVLSNILSTRYGHKIPIRKRVLIGLSVLFIGFLIFLGFIEVNTDNWQVAFFVLTMFSLAVINAIVALLQYTLYIITTKFPSQFMKMFIYGQGSGAVFSSSIQTICIAVGGGISQRIALIYFISGSSTIGLTLALYAFSSKFPLFSYYSNLRKEDTQRPPRTWAEIKRVLLKTWTVLVVFTSILLSMFTTHPTITSLVVSEYRDNGDTWSNKYFVTVITFLYGDVLALIGRMAATKPFITEKNGKYWAAACAVRAAIFLPMLWLCNAYPRNNLPVVFDHDWEYIIILGVYCISTGFLSALSFLSGPAIAKGDEEIVFEVIQIVVGISQSIMSPLGLVLVNIL